MIVIVYEHGGVHHLTNLVKLALHVVMLLLLKLLNLIILLMFQSLSLSKVSVSGTAVSFALAGP
jgi:hypothetical protein